MTPASVQRIAVIQTAFLGDVVFTSPLIRALRQRHPQANLAMVVAPRGEAIARHLPGVDEVFVLDKRGKDRSPGALRRLASRLGADLVVVPHPSLRSALLARLIPGAFRVGPATFPQRLAYDLPVPLAGLPFVERMRALGRALGADAGPGLELALSDEERAQARRLLGPGKFAAAIIGSEWATKRLPIATWAEVLDSLVERGITPLLLGSPKEKPLAEALLAQARNAAGYRSFVGNGIGESLGLIACSSVVLGGDTGLVHAARGLGVPVVALFGPTDPRQHVWEASSMVMTLGLPCQPCHPHGPQVCPLGHHDCMKKLKALEILEKIAP